MTGHELGLLLGITLSLIFIISLVYLVRRFIQRRFLVTDSVGRNRLIEPEIKMSVL